MAAAFPPPVVPGDSVGVAALSGPVDPARLDAGLDALAALGFEPVAAPNLRRRTRLFAGSDAERLDGFHALAADPRVAAIVFARGGSGLLRVLPGIDWGLLARRPRAYVGYSDLTPFLLAVVHRLGLVAFHGPMVAADLARGLREEERASFLDALAGRWPRRHRVESPGGDAVSGVLLGGCLSLLVATLGTPWAPRLGGALVFLEELDEPLYRFDRMLTHLRLSGSLAAVRGLIAGHLSRVGDAGGHDEPAGPPDPDAQTSAADPSPAQTNALASVTQHETVAQTLGETAAALAVPLATGLAAGHVAPNLTLPLGARARLDPAAGTLDVGLPSPRRRSAG